MKKLLSIVLAVAMMSVMAFSASAADVDLLAGAQSIYANDEAKATLTVNDDGSYEVVVTEGASADFSAAYGLAIEPQMKDVDLTDIPNIVVDMECDVPFRITLLDRGTAGDKWISFGSEFFNSFVAEGSEAPTTAPENNFFPAGSYNCYANFKGYYTWQADNGGQGFDPTKANITAIYIELLEPGTLKVNKMALSAAENADGATTGDNSDNKEETKATTTTKKNASQDDSTDSAKTGDVSEAIVFAAAAIVAGAVVMMTVVASKKAKSR